MALRRILGLIFVSSSLLSYASNAGESASVKVAICQILVIDSDREGNFRRIEYALVDAKEQGAQIATFPESAILGWENPEHTASPIPSPATTANASKTSLRSLIS